MKKKLSIYLSLLVMLSSFLTMPITIIAETTSDTDSTQQTQTEPIKTEQTTIKEGSSSSSSQIENIVTENKGITSEESSTLETTQTDKKQASETIQSTDQQTRAPSKAIQAAVIKMQIQPRRNGDIPGVYPGVIFDLYDSDNNLLMANIETGPDGLAHVDNIIELGKDYILKVVAAPEGFYPASQQSDIYFTGSLFGDNDTQTVPATLDGLNSMAYFDTETDNLNAKQGDKLIIYQVYNKKILTQEKLLPPTATTTALSVNLTSKVSNPSADLIAKASAALSMTVPQLYESFNTQDLGVGIYEVDVLSDTFPSPDQWVQVSFGFDTSTPTGSAGGGGQDLLVNLAAGPIQFALQARKVLIGRDLTAGAFDFELKDQAGNLIETKSNELDGTVNFSEITYDTEGTFFYTINEVQGSEPGMTYDDHVIDAIVIVTKIDGELFANAIYGGGQTFVNSYAPETETTEVKGTKTWDDADNQDGKRPDSITVNLLADGEQIATKVVTENDGWSYEFQNLPKYKDGKEIVYTVIENQVADYNTETNGFDITNHHTPETTEVKGTKTWDDANNQDGKRPDSITVNLLADGEQIATKAVTENDGWSYEFQNLPKYKDGKEIVYTITENAVENYTTEIEGFNITNTYNPGKISGTVVKHWEDKNNQAGIRPDSIKIQLYANGEKQGQPVELTEKGNWMYSWKELEARDKDGKAIQYSIKEVDVADGYTATITGENTGNLLITNTHTFNTPKEPKTPSGYKTTNNPKTPSEAKATNQPKTPSALKRYLPKTGEQRAVWMMVAGLIVLLTISMYYFYQKKKIRKDQ
ncbi:Cna B-type domain-containing protein [Enterococcus hirae]|nr:Cna B-type domain-containing protein [Enterococcus hirae]